jgi:hypothetical protein
MYILEKTQHKTEICRQIINVTVVECVEKEPMLYVPENDFSDNY